MKKKKGLTLIELLSVIAIIAILFILLIPQVSSAVNKARVTGIQTDFRSYQISGQSYFTESQGKTKTIEGFNKYLDKDLQFTNNKSKELNPWDNPYEIEVIADGLKVIAKTNTTASFLDNTVYAQNVLQYELLLLELDGEFVFEVNGFDEEVVGDASTDNGSGSSGDNNNPNNENNSNNELDGNSDGSNGVGDGESGNIIEENTDTSIPIISLSEQISWSNNSTTINVSISNTPSGVAEKKWSMGSNDVAFFSSNGAIFETEYVNVTSNGVYTVYVKANNGIESVQSITVSKVDKTAPILTLGQNSGIVSVSATDSQSGVSTLKWASGDRNNSYFVSNGTTLTSSEFTVNSNGIYTVYAKDNVGNETVKTININSIIVYEPASSFEYTVVEGTIKITAYIGSKTDVNIPLTIDGKIVTEIGGYAFYPKSISSYVGKSSVTITSVTIPNTVKVISSYAFRYNSLTSVTLPSSLETLGHYAFDSNQLTSIKIPQSVTTIQTGAFQFNPLTTVNNCSSLQLTSSSDIFSSSPVINNNGC